MILTEQQIEVVATALALSLREADYTYETILVKRSLTGDSASGPCEICDENEAEGWIDSEDVYPSGDDGPHFIRIAFAVKSTKRSACGSTTSRCVTILGKRKG